jgi:hypothetical protein
MRPYRLYLRRSPLAFILTLTFLFMASLLLVTFFTTPDKSRVSAVYPMVVLFLLAYAVHKGSLSWIRISTDQTEIVRVPSWFARRLLGEGRTVTKIASGSELILCRRMAYGGLDGYYMIVRAPNGTEQIIWNDVTGVSRRWWSRIAADIRQRYQLRVRLVSQTISTDGVEETEWTSETGKTNWKVLRVVIVPGLSPWLGILVRYLTPSPTVIVLIGVVLWLIGSVSFLYVYSMKDVSREVSPALTIFVWTIPFAIFYVVGVLVTGSLMNHHGS